VKNAKPITPIILSIVQMIQNVATAPDLTKPELVTTFNYFLSVIPVANLILPSVISVKAVLKSNQTLQLT